MCPEDRWWQGRGGRVQQDKMDIRRGSQVSVVREPAKSSREKSSSLSVSCIRLPDFTNKNKGLPVTFEFQINYQSFFAE